MSARASLTRRIIAEMAGGMRGRYVLTRGWLFFFGLLFAFTDDPDPIKDAILHVSSIVCLVGYLIAGLLKPLHDRSRNNGRGM